MAGTGRGGLGRPEFFTAPDGTRLSFRQLGDGRPLLLLHGFFSSGTANWVGNGHARVLAGRGHRLVLPDLRAHGRSATPSDYPPDVLVNDAIALLAHLGIDDLDAAGYSLGARTILRLLVRGTPIRRAVLGGQGLAAMQQPGGQTFERVLAEPDGAWFREQWARKTPDEQGALQALLASSASTSLAQIRAISAPTLVVMGDADATTDGEDLARALPDGSYAQIAGDHVRAAGNPAFGGLIADFLDEGDY